MIHAAIITVLSIVTAAIMYVTIKDIINFKKPR
jgi:hypothetical protein